MITVIVLILFLVGSMLLLGHSLISKQSKLDAKVELLGDESAPESPDVVYRYLPRDIDEFYRDVAVPTKMYSSMFTDNDEGLRIR